MEGRLGTNCVVLALMIFRAHDRNSEMYGNRQSDEPAYDDVENTDEARCCDDAGGGGGRAWFGNAC